MGALSEGRTTSLLTQATLLDRVCTLPCALTASQRGRSPLHTKKHELMFFCKRRLSTKASEWLGWGWGVCDGVSLSCSRCPETCGPPRSAS